MFIEKKEMNKEVVIYLINGDVIYEFILINIKSTTIIVIQSIFSSLKFCRIKKRCLINFSPKLWPIAITIIYISELNKKIEKHRQLYIFSLKLWKWPSGETSNGFEFGQ